MQNRYFREKMSHMETFRHILPPDNIPDGDTVAIYANDTLAGILFVTNGHLGFRYAPGWTDGPISSCLPIPGTYRSGDIHNYFDAFMPEGKRRENLVAQDKVPGNDLVSYLRRHGQDLPGDLHAEPLGKSDDSDVTDEIRRRIGDRLSFSLLPQHSLLPGVDDKIAVVAEKISGEWRFRLPGIDTPSTHIIKKGNGLCVNEAFCMLLAKKCGLPVMISDILAVNGQPAFITERYDRKRLPDGRILRIRQEDFCQLANRPSEQKYFRAGMGLSNEDIARLLPASEIPAFIAESVFSLVIGNSDDHGKNYSLLYEDGKACLAPLYDLASISGYLLHDPNARGSTRLARPIGEAIHDIDLTVDDLKAHADIFGMDQDDFAAIFQETVRAVDANADDAATIIRKRLTELNLPKEEAEFLRVHMHGRVEELYADLAKELGKPFTSHGHMAQNP